MNDQVIELRKKAWDLVQIDLQTNERDEPISEREHLKMVFEKFAELIVRECVQYIEDTFDFCGDELIIAENLKKHFGVEE